MDLRFGELGVFCRRRCSQCCSDRHIRKQCRSSLALHATLSLQSRAWCLQQQSVVIPVSKSDQEMLRELAGAGWEWRQAETWDESDCLVDSLLQVLEFLGALVGEHGPLTRGERRAACVAARQHLIATPALLPEDPYGRPQWDAYLQHHRHAEALVFFLLARFQAGPSPVSAVGVTLVVHARYDTPETPAEELSLCVGQGERRGVAPELHLFNWTGGGLQGYHYDALVRTRRCEHAIEVVCDDDGVAPGLGSQESPGTAQIVSSLKRARHDGKGRVRRDVLKASDFDSPPREAQSTISLSSASSGAAPVPKQQSRGGRARGRGRATASSSK